MGYPAQVIKGKIEQRDLRHKMGAGRGRERNARKASCFLSERAKEKGKTVIFS